MQTPRPYDNRPGLVLTASTDERIIIGDGLIVITVLRAANGKTRLHFAADRGIPINRECIQLAHDAAPGTEGQPQS